MSSIHYTAPFKIDQFEQNLPDQPRAADRVFLKPLLVSGLKDILSVSVAIVLGAGVAGLLLAVAHSVSPLKPATLIPLLSATSAGAAMLYIAGLSDTKSPKDFIAMIVPALVIWALVFSDLNNPTLLGLSLLTHAATTFYGSLSKPNSAISDLGLWPAFLGFHWVMFGIWVAQISGL